MNVPQKQLTVFIVGPDPGGWYKRMFLNRGWGIAGTPDDADILQFTGGADVSPALYGQVAHRTTYANSDRDFEEMKLFDQYKGKKPMAGICRGGQFLWVANGGEMYQDVDNHALHDTHHLFDAETGSYICDVTSTHHQMMRATPRCDVDKVIAFARQGGERRYMYEGEERSLNHGLEIEVAYIPDTNCLCFQPHPEYIEGSSMEEYYFQLIDNLLLKDKG